MNRRSILTGLGLALGGLVSGRVGRAQDPEPDSNVRPARPRREPEEAVEPPARRTRTRTNAEDLDADPAVETAPARSGVDQEGLPAAFPNEAGQVWKDFDISKYTGLPHKDDAPQSAIVDWILRRTTAAPWHGDKVAVLAAGRSRLRVYHNSKIVGQVGEIVERFTDAYANFLSLRVRFVAAADTRWRYSVYKRLEVIGTGTQGQQIWTLNKEDASLVMSQMQVWQGFRLLADQRVELINGQTLTVKTTEPRTFTGNLQRDSAVGLGFQPKTETLEEGVTLRISPLLTYEGDTLDAAVELTANTVRAFQRTKVLAPREVGPGEITIDVPEVSGTRLNVPLKGWPLGQSLLISAGIQPGILQSKGGLFNMRIPGTVPTTTELLAFVDAEITDRPTRGRE
ncbi:MAG: hypothetical protein SFX72_13230 [Isosphaeraceae bacterium]|nr:hypothetical protein [Isosphaeraceae bacterium]